MKEEKSLCRSCSNKVIIKYHEEDIEPGVEKCECFYDFKVRFKKNGQYYNYHVSNVIIDECSFYNKSFFCLKRKKIKESKTDNGDDKTLDNSHKHGITFKNILGALLP